MLGNMDDGADNPRSSKEEEQSEIAGEEKNGVDAGRRNHENQ
jgi:hypothetical protein